MIHLLKDKVALVVSDSDSVALSTSRLFLQQGASVMMVGVLPKHLADYPQFADESRWGSVSADMTDPVEARYCLHETLKRFGQVDFFFYYPTANEDDFFSTTAQSGEYAIVTYVKNLWLGLAASIPDLRAHGKSHIVVVADTACSSELTSVDDIRTEDYCIKVDMINALQTYHPKRQQSLVAHKQLTPERIARLALSLLVKEKQDDAEWNEVLSWTSEYLDAAF